MNKIILLFATVSGFLAVAIGAFGAHGLKNIITADLINIYKTGVDYHFYHTFALLTLGLSAQWLPKKWLTVSACSFVVGIMLFSGSLYAYAITSAKWLGPITPLGGVCLLLGWLFFFIAIMRSKPI